jgi:hypothetical protein
MEEYSYTIEKENDIGYIPLEQQSPSQIHPEHILPVFQVTISRNNSVK